MRTTIERPLARFVTRARVPSGSERCAAVNSPGLKRSPLAVVVPLDPLPYQDAVPTWTPWGRAGSCGATEQPAATATRAIIVVAASAPCGRLGGSIGAT